MVTNSLPRAGKGCPKDREGALILLLYEKRNLEIHSSDFGGDSYRHSDNPRRAKLHVGELKIIERRDAETLSFYLNTEGTKETKFAPCGAWGFPEN